MNGANGRNNHHEDYMSYEMCRRLHEEFSARIDVALKAGGERMTALEKKVTCFDKKLGSIKTWVIVTLAALILDLARGLLALLKVIEN